MHLRNQTFSFVLESKKKKHLDPVHAILKWIHCSRIKKGYLFRCITLHDQVSLENKPLVSFFRTSKKIYLPNIRPAQCF
jgi:hypothetical protein